jgi:HAD superfamily hydrolase (TIGR01490 family)
MPLSTNGKLPVVAAFDFDVTMTTRDTFVPFLERAFGRNRVRAAFLRLSSDALKVALGLSSRDRFKEKLVEALFRGESVEALHEVGRAHAEVIETLVRPAALRRIAWHRERGDRTVMVSASLDLYLSPVASKLGFDDLLCTRLGESQQVFDGSLAGANCRGPEKQKRLESLLGDLSRVELYAYGDSAGDREMLAAADHPYYRAFASGGALA